MVKKSVDKKNVGEEEIKVKPKRKRIPKEKKDNEIEKILINNFVSLQKVMVNLSIKFDGLTTQISKLLELFETSAKVLAEKDFDIEKNNRENVKILEKLENVLEQNRTIARGLTLMHDKISEPPNYPPPQLQPRYQSQQGQMFKPIQKTSMMGGVAEEYHKPISSNEQ
jgi:hypothetical protein